jgi:tRNA(fMet)-specific endonuclease VapC
MQYFMLDTNTVSYILKGQSAEARAKLSNLNSAEIACVSTITEAELLFGLAKIPHAVARRHLLEDFLNRILVLPWGRNEARAYGKLRAKQQAAGKTLSPLDMLIAAHAISVGAILITNDQAFRHVPDLAGVANWADDL